jgi:hypothetical protein
MRNAEPPRESRAVAVVTIDELYDAGGGTGRTDAVVQPVPVERIDQPDAAVRDERMRAALKELVCDPAESVFELVAVAQPHSPESTGTA